MTGWALSLRRSEATFLAKLYRVGDVEVGEIDPQSALVWARGSGTAGELDSIVELLPISRFYELLQDDRLRPKGRLLPTARLPNLRWISLREWLRVRVPRAALPGALAGGAKLELVRGPSRRLLGGCEEMLLCRVACFRDYLLRVPAHRLGRVRFVLNEACGEVLVRGQPLPSLPGERYILEAGIATPVGFAWSPPVGAGVIRSWLGASDKTLALWRADGSISEIAEDSFVAASRRAGRAL